uniref:COesterase domain-containing protein n=1 Tax=Strongyloides venezuelensis TaxID=75913 RepID=A0A0K0FNE5_STRVS
MYYLLESLLFLSFATFSNGDLSRAYLNRRCKPLIYSDEFECPKLNTDLITIDVATFYEPIQGDCSSNCSAVPVYDSKVIHNKEWIIFPDGASAHKIYPLLFNPHCYPEGTFVVDGNVPVSLLKDRITFKSKFEYIVKKGAPVFPLIPSFGRHKDQSITVEEKEFSMFLTMYLMRNDSDYRHDDHHMNEEFYDAATGGRLKGGELDKEKAYKLLNEMYSSTMGELVSDSEDKWKRLCEEAVSEKGQFYEEVLAGER